MIVESKLVRRMGIGGITIYPYIFIASGLSELMKEYISKHELVHIDQQGAWFKKAWYFGLLAWYFLYTFALPYIWNPFRKKWETEAYTKGSGYSGEETKKIMKKYPYFLYF